MRAILTYHSIDPSGSPVSVSHEAFGRQVAWLAGERVRVVPLLELLALPDDADAVALTFDDGLVSVATEAAPLLQAHGFSATVFVVSRQVGGNNRWGGGNAPGIPVFPLLGWDALGRLLEQGFEIGAHSRHHPRLTACSDAELFDELEGAAEDIAGRLGRRPTTFAYPYGDIDARVAAAAVAVYDLACTAEFRPLGAADPRERLPRLDAYYFRRGNRLAQWGTPAFWGYVAWRRALRAVHRAIA